MRVFKLHSAVSEEEQSQDADTFCLMTATERLQGQANKPSQRLLIAIEGKFCTCGPAWLSGQRTTQTLQELRAPASTGPPRKLKQKILERLRDVCSLRKNPFQEFSKMFCLFEPKGQRSICLLW